MPCWRSPWGRSCGAVSGTSSRAGIGGSDVKRWIVPSLIMLVLLPAMLWATGTMTMPVTLGSLTAVRQNLALFDQNFAAVTAYVNAREITQNTCANRPAASTNGRFYFCTDTSVLYADTGSAWTQISANPV